MNKQAIGQCSEALRRVNAAMGYPNVPYHALLELNIARQALRGILKDADERNSAVTLTAYWESDG